MSDRLNWKKKRQFLESNQRKISTLESKEKIHFDLFGMLAKMIKIFFKIVYPIQYFGFKNAVNLQLNKINISFDNLPLTFDNFQILHLSDLHLDERPEMVKVIKNKINNENYDLCVITGDYLSSSIKRDVFNLDIIEELINILKKKSKIIGILGNHDSYAMVESLEKFGVQLLINENTIIKKDQDQIQIIGTDDVHYFYTDEALKSLAPARDFFTIALIHSPEIFDKVEQSGCNLYLCGHTHGGQIRLTSKRPIFRRLKRGRKYYSGLWQYNKMFGYTSNGVGTSTVAARFNCLPELTIITLKRKM